MTRTPHPFAHIYRAIADGHKAFQIIPLKGDGTWQDRTIAQVLELIAHSPIRPEHMRVKPPTIRINGHEVPEPLRELPPLGTTVYWACFGTTSDDDMVDNTEVGNYQAVLVDLLAKGLLHSTHAAASAHANALVSFTGTVF